MIYITNHINLLYTIRKMVIVKVHRRLFPSLIYSIDEHLRLVKLMVPLSILKRILYHILVCYIEMTRKVLK